MFYAERVSNDSVVFTNTDDETGFTVNLTKRQFERLEHNILLNLTLERCIRLYWLMCEYRKVYITDGKLLRKKKSKKEEHTYYKIPTTKFTKEQEMEIKLDNLLGSLDDRFELIEEGI